MRRRRGKRESEVEAWPPRGPVGVQQPFTRHKRRNKRRLGAKQLKTLRPIALHRFLPFHPYPFLSFFFFLCVSHPIYPTVSPSLSLSLSRERFFSRQFVARLFNFHPYSHRIEGERGVKCVQVSLSNFSPARFSPLSTRKTHGRINRRPHVPAWKQKGNRDDLMTDRAVARCVVCRHRFVYLYTIYIVIRTFSLLSSCELDQIRGGFESILSTEFHISVLFAPRLLQFTYQFLVFQEFFFSSLVPIFDIEIFNTL